MATVRGGTKFEAALKSLAEKLKKAKVVRVGFLEDATYPDGTKVALVAATQNFGAPKRKIPPRPFFSNMVEERQKEWPKALATNLKNNGYDAAKALDLVGFGIEGQLRQSIQQTNEPPLKAATVKRKGFNKPLIDTSHMINSVDHEVE